MITESLKRGEKCYWKHGTVYSEMAFISLTQMPHPPNAVKVSKAGEEYILKDSEVFRTYTEAFCDKHKAIIEALLNRGKESKIGISKRLRVPYSRIFSVIRECKELGVKYAQETQAI